MITEITAIYAISDDLLKAKPCTRHYIETVFSGITSRFPKSIHAVTIDGFLLKIATFILVFTLEAALLA